ncbi:MAG: hypothetical protein NC087_10385, partial [Anaeroplasma bactoclasticum]|nr:hypothetical protein [Anaeroplasma bactoclasticum]
MRKRLILPALISMFLLLFSLTSYAEYDYSVINDTTTIEEDFTILGMDINDYYKPSYDYAKWYVVGMSESYLEDEDMIQTYFYLYNPTRYGEGSDYMSTVGNFELTYKLETNGNEELCYSSKLDYNQAHCLYKAKGFSYNFTDESEIYITKVKHNNYRNLGIENESSFKAKVKHSKLNGFNVEL